MAEDRLYAIWGSTIPSEPAYNVIPTSANLRRNMYFNGSNHMGTREECESAGLGYTFDEHYAGRGGCYFPCPDAYTISASKISECEPRPILTKVAIYYGILAKAVKDCAELIPAYKEAVAEANNDPTQIGFPADSGCENPFAPSPPPAPADSGVYDPSASDGDALKPADAPPMTDPNGTSGQAGQQNGGIDNSGAPFIPTMPDGTTQEPYVPPPPDKYKEIDPSDASGQSKSLPRDRLLVTQEDIDKLPKVNDFGAMVDGDLALRLQVHPTLLDVSPEYLAEFIRQVPDFVWECSITQDEFDLLDDTWKCRLCENYEATVYDNPRNIGIMRMSAPTITMTRNAPSTPPSFKNCPAEVRKIACDSKVGYDGTPCSYSGGCFGECKCAQAPPPEPPADEDNTARIWIGVGIGVAVLGSAYYLFKD